MVLARDGLGFFVPLSLWSQPFWRLSTLWLYPPCVGLKHFSVAGECGNADQAVLEADKTVCFWDSLGDKNVAELFLYSVREHVLWNGESLW